MRAPRKAPEKARARERMNEHQSKSLEGATRKGQPWSGWELALLTQDISVAEICKKTGRTYRAVVEARRRNT